MYTPKDDIICVLRCQRKGGPEEQLSLNIYQEMGLSMHLRNIVSVLENMTSNPNVNFFFERFLLCLNEQFMNCSKYH